MSLNPRRYPNAFLVILALAFAWPGGARAACTGAVLTANTTQYWAYVRVLDPTQTLVLDSGFIAPHTTKTWSRAGSYNLCGFLLRLQYQVTTATGATAPAAVGKPIADVVGASLMVLPASVLNADLAKVPQGPPTNKIVQTLTAPFWLDPADTQNVISATRGPLNAISCLKTLDNKYFGVDDATYCSKPPILQPAGSGPGSAGCGTIVTLNQTDHWVWATIYNLGKDDKYDWGWVAPHNFRAWHAGGARTPMSYMCGSFYHVRYEIKQPRNQANATDGPNLFDTEMEINPSLSLGETLKLVVSAGDTLRCLLSPASAAECAAEWGMSESANAALFGMVGSEAQGSVVCVKSNDDKSFWLENSDDCANPTGKAPAPAKPTYTLSPGTLSVLGPGGMSGRVFDVVYKGNVVNTLDSAYNKCVFVSDKPGVANFDRPHYGHIVAYKVGTAPVHWDCGGKKVAGGEVVVKAHP